MCRHHVLWCLFSRAWLGLLVWLGWDSFDEIRDGFLSVFGFSGGTFFVFSLESLILAQDERWRRA